MTLILGLNAFHADSAACIVRDGRVVAAAEEERFRREKHWAGFPSRAIAYCLAEAGAGLHEIDHIALNQNSRAHFWRKVSYAVTHPPDPRLVRDRLRNRRARKDIANLLEEVFPGPAFAGTIHHIEHHKAHLSSAFHMSPFAEAAAISVDGFGDFSSAAWGFGAGHALNVEGHVFFPHSLGVLYHAITQHLGFWNYGDEYKVMGLAAYGEPRFRREIQRLVTSTGDSGFALDLSFFRHHRERIAFEWANGIPTFGPLFSDALVDMLGPARDMHAPLEQRHRDIACSVQLVYEQAFFQLLRSLHERHPADAVAIAGGCGNNSVANGIGE